jgi:hypothetical protein
LLAAGLGLRAEVSLHPIFSDHAVLQRRMTVPVWGTAADGEKVTVEFAGQRETTVAKNGHWMVNLRPMQAGTAGAVLRAEGPANNVEIQDVVVGEVWVCSGQSNMEWPLSRSHQPEGDIEASTNPGLRLFTVTKRRSADVLTDLDYAKFFREHQASGAEVSISTYKKKVGIDLGVLVSEGDRVTDYLEKPSYTYDVSMGVYAMNRSVLDLIPPDRYFDFPSLILALLEKKKFVRTAPFGGVWLDIGRPSDYEEAQKTFANMPG